VTIKEIADPPEDPSMGAMRSGVERELVSRMTPD
jgi:hypothetical protein